MGVNKVGLCLLSFCMCSMLCVQTMQAKTDSNGLSQSQTVKSRVLTTKFFETSDELKLLMSSAQVLQDMGFAIAETSTEYGVVTAKKHRSIGVTAGDVASYVAAFCGVSCKTTKAQTIFASIVTSKNKSKNGYNARVIFARYIHYSDNSRGIEQLDDAKLYQQFFQKLSTSVVLTAHDV